MPFGLIALAVGGLASAGIGAAASSGAAKTQQQSAQEATQAQLQMFNQTQQNLSPFIQAGPGALSSLESGIGVAPQASGVSPFISPFLGGGQTSFDPLLGFPINLNFNTMAQTANVPQGGQGGFNYGPLNKPFDWSQIAQNPAFNFIENQGEKALVNQRTATGGVGGGNTLEALLQFGQGNAATFGDLLFNQNLASQQNAYQQLFNLASLSETAAAGQGQAALQTGAQIGQNIIGAGNAGAAGQVGVANALSGGINNLTSNFMLANLLSGGGGFGGGGFSAADAQSSALSALLNG